MLKSINLTKAQRETTGTGSKVANKSLNKNQDKGEEPIPSSPQAKGNRIHKTFANKINNDSRDGTEGEMLKEIENEFGCELVQAEVSISGYAVHTLNTQVHFWSGKMDAVAIRRTPEGVLQVFVVDWKTTMKSDVSGIINQWWNSAQNFKNPLYQCLVYRELLQAHMKSLNAQVGIILVPFHQSQPKISCPGLCVDFKKMEERRLLQKLNEFKWLSVFEESINVHTIKLPCKLFNESFDTAVYVDESTNILKAETRLKDILNDNATVADLLQVLDLPFSLKVKDIKDEVNKEEEVNK